MTSRLLFVGLVVGLFARRMYSERRAYQRIVKEY